MAKAHTKLRKRKHDLNENGKKDVSPCKKAKVTGKGLSTIQKRALKKAKARIRKQASLQRRTGTQKKRTK